MLPPNHSTVLLAVTQLYGRAGTLTVQFNSFCSLWFNISTALPQNSCQNSKFGEVLQTLPDHSESKAEKWCHFIKFLNNQCVVGRTTKTKGFISIAQKIFFPTKIVQFQRTEYSDTEEDCKYVVTAMNHIIMACVGPTQGRNAFASAFRAPSTHTVHGMWWAYRAPGKLPEHT